MRLINFLVSIRRLPPLSDLSGDEERFLFELFELRQRIGQIAVSDTYDLAGGKSSSTAYRMLMGLQDKGLVTLSVHEEDRRRRDIAFTDAAQQLFGPQVRPGAEARLRVIDATLVCILYIGLFHVSELVSSSQAIGGTASLLFLPAFVRLLGVLLVGWWSIPALFVASYACLGFIEAGGDRLTIATLLGAGGPLATLAAMRGLQIQPALRNLTPRDLFWLSLACAAGSSVSYNVGIWMAGLHTAPITALAATFVGDVAGTWLVIYALKVGLHYWGRLRRL